MTYNTRQELGPVLKVKLFSELHLKLKGATVRV